MLTWTRVTDPDEAVELLPAWFATRMMATHGSFGFLLAGGDVVRVRRVTAVHASSAGSVLVDVLLDGAGVPEGADMAWRAKHFLGAPVPGALLATLNLAQVALVVEFVAAEIAETPAEGAIPAGSEALAELAAITDEVAAEDAVRVA